MLLVRVARNIVACFQVTSLENLASRELFVGWRSPFSSADVLTQTTRKDLKSQMPPHMAMHYTACLDGLALFQSYPNLTQFHFSKIRSLHSLINLVTSLAVSAIPSTVSPK
jgi:hypothetical protein